MKKIQLIVLVVFTSCKKPDSLPVTPPAPVATDTLSAGWQKINFIDSSDLADIFFINNTGFAVGSNVYKSSDGGDNWSLLTAGSGLVQNSYLNIGMGTGKNAIFTADNFSFVATRNGGETFTEKQLSDHLLADVFFVDSTTAYAVANSGKRLMQEIPGPSFRFHADDRIQFYFFTDKQTGWVVKPRRFSLPDCSSACDINRAYKNDKISKNSFVWHEGREFFFLKSTFQHFHNFDL